MQFLGQILKWEKSTNLIYINWGCDLWFNIWKDFPWESFPNVVFKTLRIYDVLHNIQIHWKFESTSQTATWDLRNMKLNSVQHSEY